MEPFPKPNGIVLVGEELEYGAEVAEDFAKEETSHLRVGQLCQLVLWKKRREGCRLEGVPQQAIHKPYGNGDTS